MISCNQSSYLDCCLVRTAHFRRAAIFICLLVRGRFRASASSLACFVASRSYLPGAPVNNYTTILFCEVKSYISLKPSGVTLFRWQPLDLAVYWTIDVGRLRRYFLLPAEAEQLRRACATNILQNYLPSINRLLQSLNITCPFDLKITNTPNNSLSLK